MRSGPDGDSTQCGFEDSAEYKIKFPYFALFVPG